MKSDGHNAWRTLAGVRHLECFAHARRYVNAAAKARRYINAAAKTHWSADGLARQQPGMIGRLYQIEARAKSQLPAGHSRVEYTYAVRQQQSLPALQAFKSSLDENAVTLLQKGLSGTAIPYARNQRHYLSCFADDGSEPIESNVIERHIALTAQMSVICSRSITQTTPPVIAITLRR